MGGGRESQLVIIEKYDEFLNYIYPVLQNISRKHGIVKQRVITLVFNQVELFYKAIKSNHISKLYEADANLAVIRHHLRFLSDSKRKLITPKQQQIAEIKLAETGKILGSIIKGK